MSTMVNNKSTWSHEFICRETGEVVMVDVPVGESPPKYVTTPSGNKAYKNFGAASTVMPFYMRAGSEDAAGYDDAKKMMNHGRRRQW